MFGWPGLTGAVSRACHGRSALDVRSYWTAADARDLIAACGTEGRAAYLRLELLDLVYPLLCSLALLLVSSLLIRRLPGPRWRLLLIPAVAMTVLDYGENAAVWNILSTWPAVVDLPAHLGGAVTAAKRTAGLVAYLAVRLLSSPSALIGFESGLRLGPGLRTLPGEGTGRADQGLIHLRHRTFNSHVLHPIAANTSGVTAHRIRTLDVCARPTSSR